jgi:hypothetical protein
VPGAVPRRYVCSVKDRGEHGVQALPTGGACSEPPSAALEQAVADQPVERGLVEQPIQRLSADRFEAPEIDALAEAQAHHQQLLCLLGLADEVPDHSAFSKNRHGRFRASDLLRHVFEAVVRRCIAEGLVGGDGFAVDASLIRADASSRKGVEGIQGLAPEVSGRAVDEYLAVLDDAAFGAATEVTPKFISPADPAARWTGARGGQAFFIVPTT